MAMFALAAVAQADWRSVPAPGGQVDAFAVADAKTWLDQGAFCCPASFEVTHDGGDSWAAVQLAGYERGWPAGAVADGSFRVIAVHYESGEEPKEQVFQVGPSGESEALGPVLEGTVRYSSGAAVTEDGATWVAYRSEAENAFKLAIVAADGSVSTVALPEIAGTEGWDPRRTALGMRLVRYAPQGSALDVAVRGTFKLGEGGQLLPAEAYPVTLAEDELLVSSESGRDSWDGGAHWTPAFTPMVERAPGQGMPRYLGFGYGIWTRYSPFLFRRSGLEWPAGAPTNHVVDAGSALVAWSHDTIFVHGTDLPQAPTAIGELQPDTQRMLARADEFRADAGLPPLTGDALVSQAARNHSTYTALHPDEPEGLSPHEERPGEAGFTGIYPWNRCEAVGTICNSEVMYSPGVADPVGGWLATIYHRPLLGSPAAGVVGGAEVKGGWAVMDGKEAQNRLIEPFGYPNGRWRGEDGFGGESPDPVEACKSSGQPIEYPIGIAVTLYTPTGTQPLETSEVNRIEVRKRGSTDVLPGCLLSDYDVNSGETGAFILDDPLVPGQTYDVRAEWTPGPDFTFGFGETIPAAPLGYEWSFYFQPDRYGRVKPERSCRALGLRTIKSVARAHRGGRPHQVLGIEEKVTLKQKAKVKLRLARLNYWKAGKRYSVRLKLGRLRRQGVRVGRTSFLRFRLPPKAVRRVVSGEPAELWLKFTGRRTDTCKRVVHIARIRKVEIGWVHVRGPVAWVSAKQKRYQGR
jgi:hypothetical protein